MKSSYKKILMCLLGWSVVTLVSACPFCSENLTKNTGGFSGGITMGITITIFFLLGIMGSLVAFVIYLMIKEGKKSDLRHQRLAAQQISQSSLH